MASNRVFYAVEAVGIKGNGVEGKIGLGAEIHGLQTAGVTTDFELQQSFEKGQIEIYENYENKPAIEVTLEKVLDDSPLIFHLATSGATAATLASRSTKQCIMHMPIHEDSDDAVSGNASNILIASGLYVSSVSYNFPVDAEANESVSLVGSDKFWSTSNVLYGLVYDFDSTDTPGPDGIQRREDIVMGESSGCSFFPTEIPGISASGTNVLNAAGTAYEAHIQSISVSVDLGREDLFELGRKNEYFKFASFPTEVTTSIELTATDDGDNVNAYSNQDNLSDQKIRIVTLDDTQIYCGAKNKLSSVSYGGADATGGNATVTLTYTGYNTMTVTNPTNDPSAFAHVDR